MRLVVVESPYKGDVERNIRYARAAMSDCFKRGEAPFASHLLYTQEGILDDNDPDERATGIIAGFHWGDKADEHVFYIDLGWSVGMQLSRERLRIRNQKWSERSLPEWRDGNRDFQNHVG